MSTTKYPNADTSPERLAFLQEVYAKRNGGIWSLQVEQAIGDLLAMLQERDLRISASEEAAIELLTCKDVQIKLLHDQLHDQRWRRFSEEMPDKFPIQVQFDMDNPPMHIYSLGSLPKLYIDNSWWRPIPPLPKE